MLPYIFLRPLSLGKNLANGKGIDRKRAGLQKMNRKPGDWNCRSCQHLNFSRRDSCQRCGDQRPSGGDRSEYASFGAGRSGGSSFGFSGGSDVRPGDWYCSCGYHNFASRSSCFKCGAFKDDSASGGGAFEGDVPRSRAVGFGGGGGRAGWKSGDWICTRSGCNEHNFASRVECFRCNAPRESGGEV
ncbi:RNA-binding protein involved in heterochromatin assembly dri1 isoform X1 [Typha angustifolia]|uniref:RNA-binding protein involved in heterochromatin assembly dri1 isoform X1 n=2 Tax=Typha angustifolia TaxID=59011 RepID=UPI003C30187D